MFEKYQQKFTAEITQILSETTSDPINLSNPEKLVAKCMKLSENLPEIWINGDNSEKQALQKLVFTGPIHYNTENATYRTTKINSFFYQIAQLSSNLKSTIIKNPLINSGDSHQVVSLGIEPRSKV